MMGPLPRDRRGITSSSTPAVSNADRTYCSACKVYFPNYEHFIFHILNSRNHFACDICHIDYHSTEALDRHNKQMHPHEQEVNCPGCHKLFNRAGGLMSHIEHKECIILKPGLIEELRAKNPRSSGQFEAIKAATGWGRIAVTDKAQGSDFAGDSSQYIAGVSSGPSVSAEAVAPVALFVKNFVREQDVSEQAGGEGEDLITFEAASLVLNAPRDQPAVSFNMADFPSLPAPLIPVSDKKTGADASKGPRHSANGLVMSGHTARIQGQAVDDREGFINSSNGHGVGSANATVSLSSAAAVCSTSPTAPSAVPAVSAWDTVFNRTPASTTLFPDAPPAIVSPATLLENLTITATSAEPLYAEHDPHNPNFNASRYYNDFARSYKCPHRGCKKSLPIATAFVQHLKSPIHVGLQKVKCPHCLRPFPSATALTQHIESQGIRCNARKLENVDILVEGVTQVVTADGLHADETVRYVNIPDQLTGPKAAAAVLSGAQRVVEASRRAVDVHVKAKKEQARKLHQNQKW